LSGIGCFEARLGSGGSSSAYLIPWDIEGKTWEP